MNGAARRLDLPAKAFIKDPRFWWALLAAPLLWAAGYVWFAPSTDWAWPLHHPREFLYVVLLHPLVEEWLFRGLLQGRLRRRPQLQRHWHGLTGANALTSSVFTGLHFLMHPPLAAAAVLLPSLIFGYFRDRYGRLQAPIALHMFYNLGYFWIFG
ncbi:MAG: JDVT-CTERM system glutamic-type intramembrane protease [Thiohalobacteraceae bacterium]